MFSVPSLYVQGMSKDSVRWSHRYLLQDCADENCTSDCPEYEGKVLTEAAGMGIHLCDVRVREATNHGETTRKPILETWQWLEMWGQAEVGGAACNKMSISDRDRHKNFHWAGV